MDYSTNETTEQQLTAVKAELWAVKQEYAEYANILSHDFLAFFRQIEGLIELVSSEPGNEWTEKSNKHIDLIVQASRRGQVLVGLLHKHSSLTQDSMEFVSVDAQSIFAKVVMSLKPLTRQTNAEIISDLPHSLRADKCQLAELFYQLLHNALTYQQSQSVARISMIAKKVGSYWEFCVSDNGIGFSEQGLDKVFNLLYRGVAQTDYPDGGGVGLAIARKIVNNHGGDIWVADYSSSGSVINFNIPV